jgi:hypothetical protein
MSLSYSCSKKVKHRKHAQALTLINAQAFYHFSYRFKLKLALQIHGRKKRVHGSARSALCLAGVTF